MENTTDPKRTKPKSERTLLFGIEGGPDRSEKSTGDWKNTSILSVAAGVVPVFILFLTVGPVLVTSLQEAGLTDAEITSWMMAIHVFGGLNGVLLALYYKQPILGAYSIPGIAIVAGALGTITYPEAIAGFMVAGFLVLVLGVTGVAKKLARYIPGPIMNAMIGGLLLSFPLKIIDGVQAQVASGVIAVLGYLVFHRWVRRVPAILGALVAGGVAAAVMGQFQFAAVDWAFASPQFHAPHFTLIAIASVSIPLAIAVMGSENMQAIGVLQSVGFRPPVTAMTVASGLGGLIAGIFGGHNANIAGPGTAACAAPDAGPVRRRYVVAVVSGCVVILFGVFAPVVTQVFAFFPEALMSILVGLVLLPIVGSAFTSAWKDGRFSLSVIVTFVVAVSELSLFGISSAFWALLFGCLTAVLVETKDFKQHLAQGGAQ